MVDINHNLNSINITWVKCLIDPENTGAWKHFYVNELSKYGGLLLFRSNLAPANIKSFKIRNTFLKDILCSWSLFNYMKASKNIGSQILWNNSFIKKKNNIQHLLCFCHG